MKVFCSDRHHAHAPLTEFEGGRLVPAYEVPQRVSNVLAALEDAGFGPPHAPRHFGHEPVLRVHAPEFLRFLQTAHARWTAAFGADRREAYPSSYAPRGRQVRPPDEIEALIGYYTFDVATPILAGTWEAARAAANVALSGAQAIYRGERAAFALCRPPGHHASGDLFGGYCFLNNTAIAAQWLTDLGLRTAVLDVDCHHGNGTQDIFYERGDVLTVSLHGDPRQTYPYFSGYADETGAGPGEGANLNLPLPVGSRFDTYAEALDQGLARIRAFGPDAVVVALGVDTYADDPIAKLGLVRADYRPLGARLAGLGLPLLFVMEGGYALDVVGGLVADVLGGALGA